MKETVLYILLGLIIVVAIFAYLNREYMADKSDFQEKALITFTVNGEEVETVDMVFVKKQGEKTFNKELDTSEGGPVEHSYTGVLLRDIIDVLDIDVKDKGEVIVRAIDGYTVALTIEEVLKDDNVYLVYKTDGEYLDPKAEGGEGPYRLVIREDQFGQRWCKFVTEIEFKK